MKGIHALNLGYAGEVNGEPGKVFCVRIRIDLCVLITETFLQTWYLPVLKWWVKMQPNIEILWHILAYLKIYLHIKDLLWSLTGS